MKRLVDLLAAGAVFTLFPVGASLFLCAGWSTFHRLAEPLVQHWGAGAVAGFVLFCLFVAAVGDSLLRILRR